MSKINISNPTIFIAFGGNLGDVRTNFKSARSAIAQLANTRLIASSLMYRSPPIGPPGQPDYCNAVIAIESTLSPLSLLDALQSIEDQHHRMRTERWGARTLDLDIIAIDAHTISTDRLTVPHPEMQHRQFVLRPLCDIAPNWQHPGLHKSAAQLLQSLLQSGEPTLPEGMLW